MERMLGHAAVRFGVGDLAPFQGLMGVGGETQGVALGWHEAHLWCFDCGGWKALAEPGAFGLAGWA